MNILSCQVLQHRRKRTWQRFSTQLCIKSTIKDDTHIYWTTPLQTQSHLIRIFYGNHRKTHANCRRNIWQDIKNSIGKEYCSERWTNLLSRNPQRIVWWLRIIFKCELSLLCNRNLTIWMIKFDISYMC